MSLMESPTLFTAHRPGWVQRRSASELCMSLNRWVMPINLTRDKPSQNRQKVRQLALAQADYSFFISTPVPTALTFSLSSLARTSRFCAAFTALKLSDALNSSLLRES